MLDKFKDFSRQAASRANVAANKASGAASRIKSKGKKAQYLVALDVGTEVVKALVGEVKSSGEIEIIGVGRKKQKLGDMQAGAIADITSVVQNCDAALSQAEEQSGVNARTAIVGIAGELVKGTTTTVRVNRKNSKQQIDIVEMEKIIHAVQRRAEDRAKQQLAIELGGKDVDVRLVNSALVSIEIDGYPVTNPIGFQGKDVVVQLYTAFAPMIHIGALERTAQELDLDLLAVAAEPFAVARSVIGNNQSTNYSAILMDVGGGTTDIAVVNDGGVQGTKMFGIGGRAYTRSIERELGVEFEQAEKLKLAIGSENLPAAKHDEIDKAVDKTVKVWIDGIELALGDFKKLDHLPHRMFLCGGGSSLEALMNELENSDWYRKLAFTRKPAIHHVRPEQVVGITDTTGQVNDHTFITALGLLRVGLDTLQFTEESSGSIRDKIDRMLQT